MTERDSQDQGTTWRRVGYPETGEVASHQHGLADSGTSHAHVGGNLPHGHRHRLVGPNEFVDEFYEV